MLTLREWIVRGLAAMLLVIAADWGSPSSAHADDAVGGATLSAGNGFACAVKTDGGIACWGINNIGQVSPVPAGSYRSVSAGSSHACGVRQDGTIVCWGSDSDGQASSPVGTYSQVAAGLNHSCGLKTDGSIVCWGDNADGQVSPVPPGTYRQVSTGSRVSCGLTTGGSIACWGDNTFGAVSPIPSDTYQQVSTSGSHTCGLRAADGSIVCWGSSTFGRLMPPAGPFDQISSRRSHNCGVKSDGSVACWGRTGFGMESPDDPLGPYALVSVGGQFFTCGLKTDGTVVCWGRDNLGQGSPPPGPYVPTAAVEIGAAPDPRMFGEVEIGMSLALMIQVTNAASAEADLVVSDLQITGDTNLEFDIDAPLPSALPLTIVPGGSEDVTVRFTPAVEGLATATLQITSNDPDGVLGVSLEGVAVLAEPDFEEEIMAIMEILESGDVTGEGPGNSGAGRLQALNDMVETAGDLIDMDEIDAACGQLDQARLRTDGEFPPPDFAAPGAATDEVNVLILDLQEELGCNPKPPPGLGCGIGFELALLLPGLMWLRRQRGPRIR